MALLQVEAAPWIELDKVEELNAKLTQLGHSNTELQKQAWDTELRRRFFNSNIYELDFYCCAMQ